jgi:predicted subunit of tRNA(5-methylaminomethyl-2-thiouridylate) methyltransferase
MAAPSGPLTAQDKIKLEEASRQLQEAQAQIARAKSAGIDVADQEAEVKALLESVNRIRQAYFPTGR